MATRPQRSISGCAEATTHDLHQATNWVSDLPTQQVNLHVPTFSKPDRLHAGVAGLLDLRTLRVLLLLHSH